MNSFVVGFGVGLVLGVLFTPRSGRTVRKLIRKQTGELRESALDMVDRGRGAVTRQVERLGTPQSSGLEVYQR
jgi:gas vesicle protein